MVQGIFTGLRCPYAYFPTTDVKADYMFTILWEAIEPLEHIGLKVVVMSANIETATRALGHNLLTATSFRNKYQEGPVREVVSRCPLPLPINCPAVLSLSDTYSAYTAIADIIRGDTTTSLNLPDAYKGNEKSKRSMAFKK